MIIKSVESLYASVKMGGEGRMSELKDGGRVDKLRWGAGAEGTKNKK